MQIFRRPALAEQMANQIMNPIGLYQSILSGVFLSGMRRTGKTTFLKNDLMPALEAQGAVVIYVDLWADTTISPVEHVHAALRAKLQELATTGSRALGLLSKLRGLEIEMPAFKFGFSVETLGKEGGPTIPQALSEIVEQAEATVVLVVDEVQQAMLTDAGNSLMMAIKAARDAINLDPAASGKLIFLGTGSHRSMLHEMTTRRTQAFQGAHMQDYEVLGRDFVAFLLDSFRAQAPNLPSLDAAYEAFQQLASRPEQLITAIRNVVLMKPEPDQVDSFMRLAARMQRASMVEIELVRLEQLSPLAKAAFNRIAMAGEETRGLFAADALEGYAAELGRPVRLEEVQPAINDLLAANLILRKGHGIYGLSDPFMGQLWREKQDSLSQD